MPAALPAILQCATRGEGAAPWEIRTGCRHGAIVRRWHEVGSVDQLVLNVTNGTPKRALAGDLQIGGAGTRRRAVDSTPMCSRHQPRRCSTVPSAISALDQIGMVLATASGRKMSDTPPRRAP